MFPAEEVKEEEKEEEEEEEEVKPLMEQKEEDQTDTVALVVTPQPVNREEQQAKDQAMRAQARVRDVMRWTCSDG